MGCLTWFFTSVNIVMAEMYTPEEIQEIFDEYNKSIQAGTPITKELAEQMKDAAIGVKNYTRNLQDSMKKLGTSIKTMGKDLMDGSQGAGVFSKSIESGADAVSDYAAKFGPAGIVLGKFTQAIAAYTAASLKQSDQLFESLQKVSRAGTIGAGGMTDLYDSMQRMGYVPAQLDKMGQLLIENSKNLALFSSNAIAGGKMFAEVADTIQNSPIRAQLFNLGMSVDDINRGVAGFIKQEGTLGKLRSMTQKELNDGTKAYLREMEILTRLTGQTREEMESQREQALQIDAFYAGLKDLGPDAREQALQAFNQMAAISPKMAAEFAANFNGVITGASDLFLSTGGQVMKYNKEFFATGGQAVDAMQGISDAAKPFVGMTDNLAKIGGQFGVTSREITMLTQKGLDPFRQAYEDTANAVDKAAGGADAVTNSQARLRDSQIKAGQNLADFVNLGVNPATKALEFFTEALEYLTSWIPGAGRIRARREDAAAAAAGKTTARMDQVSSIQGRSTDITGGASATLTASEMGMGDLRIKSSEAYSGGSTSEQLISVARAIQESVGSDLRYFSAFNDSYDRGSNSLHGKGRALDFTLNDPSKADAVVSMIRSIPGISNVLNEYANPSKSATGGHIHAEIQALKGAVLSGPTSGYRPNLTMHGTEAVVPLPDGRSIPVTTTTNSEQMGMMAAQLERLDEMVTLMGRQLAVSGKLLQYQS
jgi:hypothetical protein